VIWAGQPQQADVYRRDGLANMLWRAGSIKSTSLSSAANNMGAECSAAWQAAPAVDPSIALPADAGALVLHVAASGTQNYACTMTPGDATTAPTYAFTLVAPAATLSDCNGVPIGDHSAPTGAAAPQWTNRDGSVIVGHRVAAYTADATAIPWLLLAASSHSA